MSGGKLPVIGTEGQLKTYLKKRVDEAAETGMKPAPVTLPVRDPAGIVPGLTIRIGVTNLASYSYKYGILEVKPDPNHPGHVLRQTVSHRVNLGSHPGLTMEDARMKASALRNQAHDARRGKADAPHVEERRAKAAVQVASGNTVEAIGKRYIAEYCIGNDPDNPNRRSHKEKARMLTTLIYPKIGNRPIRELTRRDIIGIMDEIHQTNGPIAANRALSEIRKMVNWAVSRDLLDASPVAGITRPGEEKSRDRVLEDHELALIWRGCDALPLTFARFVRTLMVTGQRRGEVSGMRWSEIDHAAKRWTLPASRAKTKQPHITPLSPLALDIIGKPSTPEAVYVFTTNSTHGDVPLSCYSDIKVELDAAILALQKAAAKGKAAKPLSRWTYHDLRRTLRTRLPALGVTPDIGERVLGHAIGGIRGVYDLHSYEKEKRHALQKWANALSKIVDASSKKAAA